MICHTVDFAIGGLSLDNFTFDTTAGQVTCPAGHTAALAPPSGANRQRKAAFDQCPTCPLHPRCTTARAARVLTIRPTTTSRPAARRQANTDPHWQAEYRRWRPPVERAVAWLVAHGNRRRFRQQVV